jgi:hypothetical protein
MGTRGVYGGEGALWMELLRFAGIPSRMIVASEGQGVLDLMHPSSTLFQHQIPQIPHLYPI